MNWLDVQLNYENTTQNNIYKLINNNENHFFEYYLTNNRTVRNYSQNKLGHHNQMIGRSTLTQQTFLYQAIEIYNKLPKELTLIKEQRLFKKWVKRYNLDNKTKLKKQEDNTKIKPIQEINYENIRKCEEDE